MGFRVALFLLQFNSILVWRHFLGKAFESTGGLGLDISRIFLSISDSLLRVSVADQISPTLRKFLCSYFLVFWVFFREEPSSVCLVFSFGSLLSSVKNLPIF